MRFHRAHGNRLKPEYYLLESYEVATLVGDRWRQMERRRSLVGLLTFADAEGTRWRVWRVESPRASAHLMEESYRNGWLVFEKEDGSQRRRLAQVPEDWAHLAPEHLGRLCALAVIAPPGRAISGITTVRMPITPRPADFRHDR